MSCTEMFATIMDYIEIWRLGDNLTDDPAKVGEIEIALTMANGNVVMALTAADACECNLSEYIQEHLKKLVVIEAAALFTVSCGPAISDAMRETYLTWVSDQLEEIKEGIVDPCGGAGKNVPAFGIITQSMPNINYADIIIREIQKDSV